MEIKYLVSGWVRRTPTEDNDPFNAFLTTDHPLSANLIREWEAQIRLTQNVWDVVIMNIIPMHTSA